MTHSTYQLVASDFDLTLAGLPHSHISDRTKRALEGLRERGIPFAIASGRGPSGLFHHLERNNISPEGFYFCGYGGAEIIQAWDGTEIASNRLNGSAARKAFEVASDFPVEVLPHLGECAYASNVGELANRGQAWSDGLTLLDITPEGVEELRPSKILISGEPDVLERVATALGEELADSIEVTLSATTLLEVNAAGVNKGWALWALADHLGIDHTATVAFGDNFNDIPMLRAAGLGVAVGNAVPEAKLAADRVTFSCDDDGLAYVLEELFAL